MSCNAISPFYHLGKWRHLTLSHLPMVAGKDTLDISWFLFVWGLWCTQNWYSEIKDRKNHRVCIGYTEVSSCNAFLAGAVFPWISFCCCSSTVGELSILQRISFVALGFFVSRCFYLAFISHTFRLRGETAPRMHRICIGCLASSGNKPDVCLLGFLAQ